MNEMKTKNNNLSLSNLERHLWEAAHIITGPIDASDYKTYIFPILFFDIWFLTKDRTGKQKQKSEGE